jgi:hypothetical protein
VRLSDRRKRLSVDNFSLDITSVCAGLVVNRQFAVGLEPKFVSDFINSVLLGQPVIDNKPSGHGLAAKNAVLAAPMS